MTGEWQRVTLAADCCVECPCGCEEAWCSIHDDHYADCDCIGPTEDDVEYEERDGELWGRRILEEDILLLDGKMHEFGDEGYLK